MSTEVKETMLKLLLGELGKFTLADDNLGEGGWSLFNTEFLNFCLKYGIISSGQLEKEVKRRIVQLGRDSYLKHVSRPKIPPDHVISPQALAYTMRHGGLSLNEIHAIKFDHGESVETFFPRVNDSFPTRIELLLRGITETKEAYETHT